MSEFDKLDTALLTALRVYREEPDAAGGEAAVGVTLRFEGDLAPIEDLGFETHAVSGDEAMGVVRFDDVRRLVEHAGVVWMAAGEEPEVDLETAARDVKARASTLTGGAPDGGLWHAVVATGAFTHAADASGEGVIVAVIDTGIDFTHPMFMKTLDPHPKTRILRIWDQGLVPAAMAECPPAARLVSADTYGVEFDDTEIDAALGGGPAVLHKDCEGHGTHVAGIAAGGSVFPAGVVGADASVVGIAPEADIIAVKLLDNPSTIHYRLPPAATAGAPVGWTARFRDAVMYCLRTARDLGKPVVINLSLSDSSKPGDGLDEDAKWVDERMLPGQPAGPMNFPEGAIVVKSSGNFARPSLRRIAKITVPAPVAPATVGEITVPLELTDGRVGINDKFKRCARLPHSPPVSVHFWYRRATPFSSVEFALRLPHQAGFSGDMPVGGHLERGFVPRVGPPPSVAFVAPTSSVHAAFVNHEGNPAVTHPDGTSVRRHRVVFHLQPKVSGGTVTYHAGIYEMRIKAPEGTEIFVTCGARGFSPGHSARFGIANHMHNGDPLPATGLQVISEFSTIDPYGRHVISVAAYDDRAGPNQHRIAPFSSRGPVRNFSKPPGGVPAAPDIAPKPDIAAPGVQIHSAQGVDTDVPPVVRVPAWNDGKRFIPKGGTSMATPVVVGVVALMLDKKDDLNTTQVRGFLQGAARDGVHPAPPGTAHTRAYGGGMVDALEAHDDTT